jgi:hypothetical protein
MLIDRTHRAWIIATGTALLLAAFVFVLYSRLSSYGPSGGTLPGIAFGVVGYGLMWYVFLLWARKKFPNRHRMLRKVPLKKLGRVQSWMKGHLWLGLLSYPLIFFHGGGLHFGHGLTRILMWVLTIVIVTGVLGVLLQHFMPRLMTEYVPMESIYNNIDAVLEKLREEAGQLIASLCDQEGGENVEVQETRRGATLTALAPSATSVETCLAELRYKYDASIKPYLAKRNAYRHELSSARTSKEFFSGLRSGMPQAIATVINQLEEISQEKRDLDRQTMMHRILHGWLLVHVPLSVLVIVLGAVHAVMALHYL